MCSEQPKENMLDIHITHGNSMYQSLPKLISLSEHFLEDHTCIVLFLYLATKHIYIYTYGSWHYSEVIHYKVMKGLIV
jgi:hypothetical protein